VNTKIENNPKHAQLAADFQWGKDLGGSDETIISQMHEKPVFVTHYPRQAKAFYMKTGRDNEKVVLNFDCLPPPFPRPRSTMNHELSTIDEP
jgi:aspartyl/asparaginyl-tRNA synthetase